MAWLLAHPSGPDAAATIRVLSDLLGATVLGLCLLELLQRGDRRPAVPLTWLWRPMAVAAAAWAVSEAALLVAAAAETAEVPAGELDPATLGHFVAEISVGRIGFATVLATAALSVAATVAFRRDAHWPPTPFAAVAALALVARSVTGHMSAYALGPVLVAAHVLAASLWIGPMIAMALVLRGRGSWATLLPRYSDLAWKCVAVVTITGTVDAAVALGGLDALVTTGYGRIVLAKTVGLLGLVALGWWWRRGWVPAAAAHRSTQAVSLRNAGLDVLALAVVFGLAAALATTG
ncbi:copper resistance D family protein [Rhodococcus gannanensis]|uniref:Copper resistance D family protein n=1 Tax=Rhodococcus gannanensis TaxID=1960308 RepID=A0ABW4P5E0_9NOCA